MAIMTVKTIIIVSLNVDKNDGKSEEINRANSGRFLSLSIIRKMLSKSNLNDIRSAKSFQTLQV